jgi:hypothetical protein
VSALFADEGCATLAPTRVVVDRGELAGVVCQSTEPDLVIGDMVLQIKRPMTC